MELTYTFRGVDDAELQARIADTLPMLQDMMEACEDRHAARQSQREAAKETAASAAAEACGSNPEAELRQLVQRAVKEALSNGSNGHSYANGSQPPAAAAKNGQGGTWCDIHQVTMKLRTNAGDSWYSHWVQAEERWCRGE